MIYLDDILIYSQSQEEHEEHLKLLFEQLSKNQLYVKFSKCEFFQKEIEFLGY